MPADGLGRPARGRTPGIGRPGINAQIRPIMPENLPRPPRMVPTGHNNHPFRPQTPQNGQGKPRVFTRVAGKLFPENRRRRHPRPFQPLHIGVAIPQTRAENPRGRTRFIQLRRPQRSLTLPAPQHHQHIPLYRPAVHHQQLLGKKQPAAADHPPQHHHRRNPAEMLPDQSERTE